MFFKQFGPLTCPLVEDGAAGVAHKVVWHNLERKCIFEKSYASKIILSITWSVVYPSTPFMVVSEASFILAQRSSYLTGLFSNYFQYLKFPTLQTFSFLTSPRPLWGRPLRHPGLALWTPSRSACRPARGWPCQRPWRRPWKKGWYSEGGKYHVWNNWKHDFPAKGTKTGVRPVWFDNFF